MKLANEGGEEAECVTVPQFRVFFLWSIWKHLYTMPSAQDPFYVVKEEIQESVSIFFSPILPRFCFKFNFEN